MLLGLTPRLQHIWNKITRLRKDRIIKWEGGIVTWVCILNKTVANFTMSYSYPFFFWPHLTSLWYLSSLTELDGPPTKESTESWLLDYQRVPKRSFYCYNKGNNSLLARKCTLKETLSIIPLENGTSVDLPTKYRNSRTVKKDVSIVKILQAIYKQSNEGFNT